MFDPLLLVGRSEERESAERGNVDMARFLVPTKVTGT